MQQARLFTIPFEGKIDDSILPEIGLIANSTGRFSLGRCSSSLLVDSVSLQESLITTLQCTNLD